MRHISTDKSNGRPFVEIRNFILAMAFSLLPAFAHADESAANSPTPVETDPSKTVLVSTPLQSQQATPPTPVQTADSVSNQNASLWDRIRSGFSMAPLDSPLIQTHIDWYAKRPDYVARMLDRSRRYLYHIVQEVDARGMPMEIALLPMVESAFNPQAFSRSNAAGIWQFMPSTGKNYGLQQDHWYDGRRDVTAATQAALDYLQKLYVDFGSWDLALAAYNCGEGCVSRAIQKNAARGLPTDYVDLPLPPETRHYVPKLMAVKQLVLNPESFGVELSDIPNAPYFTQVSLNAGAIDMRSAARLAGLSVEEFTSLNPAFPRKLIKSDGEVPVLVPVTNAGIFQSNLEKGEWDSWEPVTAKKGMTLAEIADEFDTTQQRIADHNQLHMKFGKLIKDQVILVPISGNEDTSLKPASWQQAAKDAETTSLSSSARYYTVRHATSVSLVAKKFHISVAQLKRWNKLKSSRLKTGQRIVIAPAGSGKPSVKSTRRGHGKSAKIASKSRKHYVVKRGDTLYSIASRFNVSVEEIKAWNKLSSVHVQAGRRLTVEHS